MSDLPRRLKYKKNKQENEPDKNVDLEKIWNMPQEYKKELEKKTTELALIEMRSFREKYNRYPDKKEMDEIAENIFEQVKAKDEKIAAHKRDSMHGKNVSSGKSFLDERKLRREGTPQTPAQKPQEAKADNVLERRLKRNAEKAQREAALKKEKPKEKFNPRDKEPDEENEESFEEKKPSKKLDVKDLLSGEKDDDLDLDDEDDTGLEDFSEEKDDTDLGGLEDLDEEDETEKCPNCKRVAQKTFFCPKCGKGFCSKCAKKLEKLTGNQAKLVCPKCSNEFKTSVN